MMAVLLTQDLFVGILEAIQGRSIEAFLALAPRVINRLDLMSHLLQESIHLGRPRFSSPALRSLQDPAGDVSRAGRVCTGCSCSRAPTDRERRFP